MALVSRLPQAALSRLLGRCADFPVPRFLRRPLFGLFAKTVGIAVDEAEFPLSDYPSLSVFFVRRLRPGIRPMPDDSAIVVSPVDGQLAEYGPIEDGRLLQVKGIRYGVADLLDDPSEAARFDGGSFLTLYLSPGDYHRIHAPCAGGVVWARHIPGRLLPVNRPFVALTPDLFVRNERLAYLVEGDSGASAMVAVGAFNVGRISSAFDPEWNGPRGGVTNRRGIRAATRTYQPPIRIERGEEVMAFHLGSTVVLLFEADGPRPLSDLESGQSVLLGQELAH